MEVLCMFSPRDRDLERGWPGRIEGERVVQLAAQTLQAYFTGGGQAREHAEYPLAEVVLRAPVLRPPSVRIFDDDGADFRFANPAAIRGPDDVVLLPEGVDEIVPVLRHAAVVGAEGRVGAYTLLLEWTAPALAGEKRRDFALSLGPTAVTEVGAERAEWDRVVAHAARNTELLPGDVIAIRGRELAPVEAGGGGGVEVQPFGTLRNRVEARG
jgi:hypothetical protein